MQVPYSAGTQRPRLKAPVDACDCHMHIFDSRYPMAEGAPSVPDAGVGDYRRLQERLGLSRTVVVAPSMYGLDNRCTLDATLALGKDARCVVSLGPESTIEQIEAMHRAGARGFRFNLARSSMNSLDTLEPIARRVAPLGWHMQLWMHPDGLPEAVSLLERLPIPTVLDHMAGIPLYGGRAHPALRTLLSLLGNGRTWMKLSLATAWPQLESARPELNALAREFVAAAPQRVVWGSDWPHAMSSVHGRPFPDDAAKLDALLDWVDDEATLKRILVDNPAELYQFDA